MIGQFHNVATRSNPQTVVLYSTESCVEGFYIHDTHAVSWCCTLPYYTIVYYTIPYCTVLERIIIGGFTTDRAKKL